MSQRKPTMKELRQLMTGHKPQVNTEVEPVTELEEGALAKTTSIPARAATPEVTELKPHISAPSYLHSLAEIDLPPFKSPGKEAKPILLAGPHPLVNEQDVIEMIATSEADPENGLTRFLSLFLVEKKIVRNSELIERDFLVRLLKETVRYAAQQDLSAFKLSMLLTIYLTAHLYFKWYYWSTPTVIWDYFKELMIRHYVEDSPEGQAVFEPDETYDILTHFHAVYISNLPLIHILTFGVYRLRLNWPYKKP